MSKGTSEISRKTHAMIASEASEYPGGESSTVAERSPSDACCVSRGSPFLEWDAVDIVVERRIELTERRGCCGRVIIQVRPVRHSLVYAIGAPIIHAAGVRLGLIDMK